MAIRAKKVNDTKKVSPTGGLELGVRVVARRDSAVTLLRRVGIKQIDYDRFLTLQKDGSWHVRLVEATQFAELMVKPITKGLPEKTSIAADCLTMFKQGIPTKEVWQKLQERWGLDKSKAHYPAWYKSHFRRRGLIPSKASIKDPE